MFSGGLESVREVDIFSCYGQRCSYAMGGFLQDSHRSRFLIDGDYGNALFYHARFFFCNAVEGISEQILVVYADTRNSDERRFDDVCTVESSSEAGFDYGDINFFVGKVYEGKGGKDFKKCWGLFLTCHFFDDGLDSVNQAEHILFGNHFGVYCNPFVQAGDMWRGVQAHIVAVCLDHFCKHCCGRAFSLCAGDVYSLGFLVWISNVFKQLDHSVQVECGGVIAQGLLPLIVGFSEKILHCLGVGSKNRLSLDFSDR